MLNSYLHTKVIIADKTDGDAEIWVGSHNWTQFALKGPNTEATLAITCQQTSPFYSEMNYFLQDIKDKICDPFDRGMVNDYKKIQADLAGKTDGETVIVIEAETEAAHLIGTETILIFGTVMEHYNSSMDKVNQKIVFRIHDSQSRQTFLHHGRITGSGQMKSFNRNVPDISFTDQIRYTFCTNRSIPKLEPAQHIPLHIMERSKYYVALHLDKRESRPFTISEYIRPEKTNWVDEDSDPIYDRMPVETACYSIFDSFTCSEKPARIQVPFFKRKNEEFPTTPQQYYLELPLEEKRERQDFDLIRKATIEYKYK